MLEKTGDYQTDISLLLHCAHSHLNPEQIEDIQKLAQQDIDWEYVLAIAERHEITPLLYRSLQTSCPQLIPSDCLKLLHHKYQEITQHNFVLAGQLIRLMNLFEAHHIRAVPLKGPLLAHLAYGDITLRQFSDLDILVHRDDISRARDLLLTQGYQTVETKAAGHFEDQKHDIGLIHSESRVHIELHREIAQKYYGFSLNPDTLLQTAHSATLLNKTIPSLRVEDWLLTVCVHGTKHAWEQLKFICDVGELIAAYPDTNWETVRQMARQTNSERALLVGLCLAQRLLNVQLPQGIGRNKLIKRLADQAYQQLFHDPTSSLGVVRLRLAHLRFQLYVQKGFRSKLRYLRYFIAYWLLIPDRPDQVVKLPGKLNILYYVVRPFRLFVQYGLGSLKQYWSKTKLG